MRKKKIKNKFQRKRKGCTEENDNNMEMEEVNKRSMELEKGTLTSSEERKEGNR